MHHTVAVLRDRIDPIASLLVSRGRDNNPRPILRSEREDNQKSMLLVALKTTASSSRDDAFSDLGNGEDRH